MSRLPLPLALAGDVRRDLEKTLQIIGEELQAPSLASSGSIWAVAIGDPSGRATMSRHLVSVLRAFERHPHLLTSSEPRVSTFVADGLPHLLGGEDVVEHHGIRTAIVDVSVPPATLP